MNVVLLSGGSGKRMWPLSNAVRSKQFIRLFDNESGERESMIERTYRSLEKTVGSDRIVIAAGGDQVGAIHNHLGDGVDLCIEPCRRDTFPAIALASVYLKYVRRTADDECVIVCPVDQYVDEDFFRAFHMMEALVRAGESNLVLMGVEPTGPSEKYGYIVPETDLPASAVRAFREKPDSRTAMELIRQGALWNAGVFGFRLGYLLEKARESVEFEDYEDLRGKYAQMPKISFDYAVVEKEEKIQSLRFSGQWRDVGTWSSLCEVLEKPVRGKAVTDAQTQNVHVVNELDIPIAVMGGKDLIVAAGPDGILVADKRRSDHLKEMVDRMDAPVRFAEEAWGSCRVLDMQENSRVMKIELLPGALLECCSHCQRSEVWTVLSGEGEAFVDGNWRKVFTGSTVQIPVGCRHMLRAHTAMTIVEVQSGMICDADAQKHPSCGKEESVWRESGS